jgi:hypothetical protein
MANTNGMEIKNDNINAEVAAFKADVELENYRHAVETGALTEEEKADRKEVLDFLGY